MVVNPELRTLLVMCEKPLTPTAAEAEELFKIAKANKRILGVYQNRRWDGDFLTIQKLIKDNTVSLVSFVSQYWV
jgi:predicted dehydrogenase